MLGPIVSGRNLTGAVPAKLLEAGADPRQSLRAVLRAWLPLSEAVLGMAVGHLPSPALAAPLRVPRLLEGGSSSALVTADEVPAVSSSLPPLPLAVAEQLACTRAALCCSSSAPDAPLVVYISKMVAVPVGLLPRDASATATQHAAGSSGNDVFLAFGRVFSGIAREGARVHVLGAGYDPRTPDMHRQVAVLGGLYLMMGRALERLPQVPAGNVCAIAGLDTAILKCGTLAGSPAALPMAPMTFQAAPIVRVALEPSQPGDMAALADGLRLLNRYEKLVQSASLHCIVVQCAQRHHCVAAATGFQRTQSLMPFVIQPALCNVRHQLGNFTHPAGLSPNLVPGPCLPSYSYSTYVELIPL